MSYTIRALTAMVAIALMAALVTVAPAAGQSPMASMPGTPSAAPCASPMVGPSPMAPAASMVATSLAPSLATPCVSPAPVAAAAAVSIKDFSFQPATISVPVGGTVTWTNNDTTGHTVTADDGSFDSGTVSPGATFSQTFATAGTFTYHCNIHPSMTASITVQ